MLSLFRRRKPVQDAVPTDQPNGTANYLADKILNCQMRFVRFMSRKEQKASLRQKKAAFVIFCILMSAVYIGHLYKGLFTASDSNPHLQHEHLQMPRDIVLPDSLDIDKLRLYRKWQQQQDSLQPKQ